MAPFHTNEAVTMWLPLTPIPPEEEGGTGLLFASGSHRDFALSFWEDARGGGRRDLEGRYALDSYGRMEVGDATWHHGWCLHSSGPNDLEEDRMAFTLCFVADGAEMLEGGEGKPVARQAVWLCRIVVLSLGLWWSAHTLQYPSTQGRGGAKRLLQARRALLAGLSNRLDTGPPVRESVAFPILPLNFGICGVPPFGSFLSSLPSLCLHPLSHPFSAPLLKFLVHDVDILSSDEDASPRTISLTEEHP
jgi:hypothetical protein